MTTYLILADKYKYECFSYNILKALNFSVSSYINFYFFNVNKEWDLYDFV